MRRTLLLLVVIAAGCATSADNAATTTAGSVASTTVAIPPGEAATVLRVFDGDSFEAQVDGATVEVRLLGINAPERDECHGDAARARLGELLDGAEMTLVPEGEDDTDRFGRLLRVVFADGILVNTTLVAEGHAVALQGGAPREPVLVAATDDAYEGALGMWAPGACDESASANVAIVHVEYDPPGRDWQNTDEEWIDLRNEGSAAVAVGGWILRDESSTHRYEFPADLTIGAGAELRIRTGCGDDRPEDVYWCADDAVWSNGGDTVIVQTAAGTVVARLRYDGDY